MEELDPLQPSVRLSTGEVLRPDIVIGADGYQSLVQRTIEKDIWKKSIDEADEREPYRREDSGTVVYSLNVDISDITPESDPELYEIVHQNEWTAYMGPYISILTSPSVWYLIGQNVRNVTKSIHFLRQRNYKEFGIQMFIPDVPGSDDTWDRVLPMDQVNTSSLPPVYVHLRNLLACEHALKMM